jgi:hypothetical protein
MAIQGLRDTSNFVANQRPQNWRQAMLLRIPNSAEAAKAPLTALTSLLKEESTDDFQFNWWEKSQQTRRIALGQNLDAPVAGTQQTVTVVSGALGFKAGDAFMVEKTKEALFVVADPTSDTAIQVARGWGGTTPTAVTYAGASVNPNLVCIGSAYEQGSLAPTGVQFDPTQKYNYTQIFRSTIELTRTAIKTKLRTPMALAEAKRECLEILGIDMERAFLYGTRSATTRNGKPLTTTGGLLSVIPVGDYGTGNRFVASGNQISMDTLDAWMLEFFRYGASEKIALGGNMALKAINQCVRKNSAYQIFDGEKEYGMRVTRIISPYGTLVFKAHPLMTTLTGGVNGGGGGTYYGEEASMFVIDATALRYRYLTDSDVKYETDLEVPGMDGTKEGYIGECGLEIGLGQNHFYCTNLAAGVADT